MLILVDDNHFCIGVRPKCGKEGKLLNYEKTILGVCEKDKVYWAFGNIMNSYMRYENEKIWEKNAAFLRQCEKVEPDWHWHIDTRKNRDAREEGFL
jgi:hypothetical protein